MRTAQQWREEIVGGWGLSPDYHEEILQDMEELERQVEFWKGEQIAWQKGWEAKCEEKQELQRQVEELENEKQGFGKWKLYKRSQA